MINCAVQGLKQSRFCEDACSS